MTRKSPLLFWAITSALAGFLFGFDTVVISGAEKQIQDLWSLSGAMHGWALSAALWGTVLGALLGGFPTARFGRKRTLISIGILYLLSALGSALAPNVVIFMLSRLIGGLGVGVSTIAAPLFISEIAPAGKRGRLAGLFQFNIVFGILVAYFSNFLIGGWVEEAIAWRWMLGVEALPALFYAIFSFTLPESPRWLITHAGKKEEGTAVFRLANPEMSEEEISVLVQEVEESASDKVKTSGFWTRRLRLPIMLAFLVAFFNQLSGINVILYFAPRLLGLAGIENPLGASISLGVTNLIFTFVGLWLIDRLGRRTLLYIGSVGYIVSLGVCAVTFLLVPEFGTVSGEAAMSAAREPSGPLSLVVLISMVVFIAAHAVGQGTVIWVLISEIFPNDHRAAGQSLGSFTHWMFAALLTLVFPIVIRNVDAGYIFAFFAFMMILQLIWVKVMVPETRGKSLEEISRLLGA